MIPYAAMKPTYVPYAPPLKDPLDRNQSSTDRVFSLIFGLFFAIWLFLGFYVIHSVRWMEKTEEDTQEDDLRFMDVGSIFMSQFSVFVIPCVTLTGVMILGFLRLIYWYPKMGVYTAVILFICSALLLSCGMMILTARLARGEEAWDSKLSIFIGVQIYVVAIMRGLRLVDLNNIADFIRKSLEAMFEFPSLILFCIIIFLLKTLLGCFVQIVSMHFSDLIKIGGNEYLLVVPFTLGNIYSVCIHYFGIMVTSQTVASWHWSEDKSSVSYVNVLRSVIITLRYHLGSLVFASTLIGPLCLAIYTAIRHKSQKMDGTSNLLIQIVWYPIVILAMPSYSTILVSVYGLNTMQSTEKAWKLLTKNSPFAFILTHVFATTFLVGATVVSVLSILLFSPYIHRDDSLVLTNTMLSLFCLMIVGTIVNTTLLFSLEKANVCSEKELADDNPADFTNEISQKTICTNEHVPDDLVPVLATIHY